jgi:hypothetical protein
LDAGFDVCGRAGVGVDRSTNAGGGVYTGDMRLGLALVTGVATTVGVDGVERTCSDAGREGVALLLSERNFGVASELSFNELVLADDVRMPTALVDFGVAELGFGGILLGDEARASGVDAVFTCVGEAIAVAGRAGSSTYPGGGDEKRSGGGGAGGAVLKISADLD